MMINENAKRQAKQLFRYCIVDGLPNEKRTRQVVNQIIVDGRQGGLAILAYFRRLLVLNRAEHTAAIESAVPLPTDLQAVVQSGLTRRFGPGLTAIFTHRPALIGGMRIQVGCDVYDTSIRGGLAALEKSFEAR